MNSMMYTYRCPLYYMPLINAGSFCLVCTVPYQSCFICFALQETRAAAEACKNGLDGVEIQGKMLRVRFATHSAALTVKNLTPHCTNELLAHAFSQFGEVSLIVVAAVLVVAAVVVVAAAVIAAVVVGAA